MPSARGNRRAPSFIVRLRCDPLHTAIDGAHANAIGATLEASGFASFAAKLRQKRSEGAENERPGVIVVLLEDAAWCDARSAEIIANLADERTRPTSSRRQPSRSDSPYPAHPQALLPVQRALGRRGRDVLGTHADGSLVLPAGGRVRLQALFGGSRRRASQGRSAGGRRAPVLRSRSLTNAGFTRGRRRRAVSRSHRRCPYTLQLPLAAPRAPRRHAFGALLRLARGHSSPPRTPGGRGAPLRRSAVPIAGDEREPSLARNAGQATRALPIARPAFLVVSFACTGSRPSRFRSSFASTEPRCAPGRRYGAAFARSRCGPAGRADRARLVFPGRYPRRSLRS